MSGASNCTQRTEDLVSGSSTQTCALAAFWLREADAMAVRRSPAITAARPTATTLRETSFTDVLLSSTEPVLSRLTLPSPQAEESREERRRICGLRQVTAVSGQARQSQGFLRPAEAGIRSDGGRRERSRRAGEPGRALEAPAGERSVEQSGREGVSRARPVHLGDRRRLDVPLEIGARGVAALGPER